MDWLDNLVATFLDFDAMWQVFPQLLGVGSWHTSTVFHSLELREVTGTGKGLRDPSTKPPPPSAAPANVGFLLRELWTGVQAPIDVMFEAARNELAARAART